MILLHFQRWLKAHTDIPFITLLREGLGELRSEFEQLGPVCAWNEMPQGDGLVSASGGLSTREQFARYLDDTNVRLIYSNTITNGEVLEALANPRRPVITHVHELEYWIRHRMDAANLAQNRRITSRFVAVSQAVKENLVQHVGIGSDKIDVIYEFVPTGSYQRTAPSNRIRAKLGIPIDAFVVGGAGTTDWRKAPDVFVQLAAMVRRIRPEQTVHFLWVGGEDQGPGFSALWHDVVRTGVADRVHFVGIQPNPLDYFAAFDVFAMVSREDPFPLVVLEAAFLAKPVVCFDLSGGTPEFVEHDAGIVVPYLDLEAMARAILRLSDNPELCTDFGRHGAAKVAQRHDVDVVAPQLLDVIQQFLSPEAGRELLTAPKPERKGPDHAAGARVTLLGASPRSRTARLIAFYLPQFYPIPENDASWGQGFTEWTSVAAAHPLFTGHPQPNLPADLGFYDLRLPEVRQAQADLAREYGIYGFCYYHYWFNGKLLLERPFNEVVASGRPDFPFCLCWANENWTRAWDGHDQDVLIAQAYGKDDDRQHMRWLARALRDSRYIRVDGKPLLLVYRVSRLANPGQTASTWREEARKLGLGDIFLASVESLRDDRVDPRHVGFDATVEFQPDWLNVGSPLSSVGDGNFVYSYASLAERALAKPAAPFRQLRCVTTGWDNTPRRRRDACIFLDSTPELYQQWLEGAIAASPTTNEAPIVFVNAWNEWAEGAHLEPSQRWGRRYLEATRRALRSTVVRRDTAPDVRPEPGVDERPVKVSVCIPTYNGAAFLAEAVQSVLTQTLTDFELLIVDDCSEDGSASIARSFSDPRVRHFANPTRLGLVGNWNRCIELARGEHICVFHQDDVMAPENLEQKSAFLDEHPSVGFVHSNVLQVGARGELISKWWYFEPTPDQNGLHRGQEYFKTLLTGPNIVSCPSVMVRRSCYEAVGRFNPSLPFTADWEMWLRAALHFDVGYLVAPLVHYRRHDRQETLRFSGLNELEQGYLAKRLVLSSQSDRIPDLEVLTASVMEHYRDAAVALWRQCRIDGKPLEASGYLSFAIQVQGTLASSPRHYTDWFVGIAEALEPLDSDAAGHPAPGAGQASPTAEAFQGSRAPDTSQVDRRELQRARNQIAALHQSLSWKVTGPLRAGYEVILRLKRLTQRRFARPDDAR